MKRKPKKIKYILAGTVENTSRTRLSPGYSREGREYPWLTRRAAQAEAKREKAQAVFVDPTEVDL